MTTENKRTHAAMIGLGLMGSALADALISKGFEVTVWNRNRAKARRYGKAGAAIAPTVEDSVRAAEITIVCPLDHGATRSAVMTDNVHKAIEGKTLVQLSTMTSDDARELGQWVEGAGGSYLEGQVLNYPEDIRSGKGIIVSAGRTDVFQSYRHVLEAMAGYAPHLSETLGAAAVLDKALFQILYPAYVGFLHGAVMCERQGIPIETYAEIVRTAYFDGSLMENELVEFASRISAGNFDKDVKAALRTYGPAFAMTLQEGVTMGLEMGHIDGVVQVLKRACEAGHGDHDFSAVYELLRGKK